MKRTKAERIKADKALALTWGKTPHKGDTLDKLDPLRHRSAVYAEAGRYRFAVKRLDK